MRDAVVKSVLAGVGLVGAGASWAGAAVVFQENFDLGNRPRGSRGDLRVTDLGDSLADYWVAYPGVAGVRWGTAAVVADSGWRWGGQSDDPGEPAMSGQAAKDPFNGIAVGNDVSSAAAPFAVTAGESYTMTVGVLSPNNYVGNPDPGADLVRVGFASAGATGVDNLEANGVAWLVLRSTGVLELHTPDAMVSEQLPGHSQVVNSLEHLALQYDAAGGVVRAWSDLGGVMSLPVGSFAPAFVGMDSHIVTNDDLIAAVGWMRVTNEVPEPAGLGVVVAAGVLVGRRRRRRVGC